MARRGWRVKVQHPQDNGSGDTGGADSGAGLDSIGQQQGHCPLCGGPQSLAGDLGKRDEKWKRRLDFPDVEVVERVSTAAPLLDLSTDAEMVRFGVGSDVLTWLQKAQTLPAFLVVQGPVPAKTWTALQKRDYRGSALIKRDDWPAGGISPKVVAYETRLSARKVTGDHDLYLRLQTGCGTGK